MEKNGWPPQRLATVFFLQKQFCKKTLKLVREFNLVQTGADRQCLCSRPLPATAYGGHTLAARAYVG
jgi:hypothetical protein